MVLPEDIVCGIIFRGSSRPKAGPAPLPAGCLQSKELRFEHLERLLLAAGFVARKTSGSHVVFKRGPLALTVPKRRPVKEVYVEQALALVENL